MKARWMFLLAVAWAGSAFAEGVIGLLDVRPSFRGAGQDKYFTENYVEAGYQLSDTVTLSYVQGFYTEISNFRPPGQSDFLLDVGYFRVGVGKLYVSADETVSLSYSARVYTPLNKAYSEQTGFITTNRNYFNLTKKISDSLSLTASEVLIFHAYDRAGYVGASGPSANPIFENRLYLIADVKLAEGLRLSLPLMFHQSRLRDFRPAAKNNNGWSLYLWTWPELLYSLTPKTTVGIAYYSDNLLKDGGLSNGTAQIAFQARI